jgi:dTDP-4-dehydrorhamnose reductase
VVWLVTGGTGQLGLALQRELTKQGIEHIAPTSKELDLTEFNRLEDEINKINPSVIVNTAAWTDVDGAEENPDLTFEINAQAPAKLAEIAKALGSVFIQISTDYVFEGESSVPYSEDHERNPQSAYGKSKFQGEKNIEQIYKDGSYIFRTAWLYSADRKNFAKTMTKLALKKSDEVKVVNDQLGQPTFAGDLATKIIDSVISKSPFGVYHATNSGEATWFEFAREIFKLVGEDIERVVPVASSEFPRPAKRPAYSVLGHESWKRANLGEMRNWRTALASAMPTIIQTVKGEESKNEIN